MCAWLLMASGMAACLHVGRERGAGGMLQYCNTAMLPCCHVAMALATARPPPVVADWLVFISPEGVGWRCDLPRSQLG